MKRLFFQTALLSHMVAVLLGQQQQEDDGAMEGLISREDTSVDRGAPPLLMQRGGAFEKKHCLVSLLHCCPKGYGNDDEIMFSK